MENFALILVLFCLGYGLRRAGVFPEGSAQAFNLFVIYVPLPALILLKVPSMAISGELLVPMLLPWAMLGLSAGAVLALARRFGWDRGVTGALLLTVPLGNTSFVGIPMVTAFYGGEGVPYAVVYDQLGTFMALATYGAFVIAAYGSGGRPTLPALARKMFTFPPFIALVLAFLLRGVEFPLIVIKVLEPIAGSLVPVVMVAVGFQLRLRLDRAHMGPMAAGLAIKLVAAPLVALLCLKLLNVSGLPARVAVFEAGMAPMITAGALAIIAGLAADLSAAMVGYGLVLSFITLPILHRIISLL